VLDFDGLSQAEAEALVRDTVTDLSSRFSAWHTYLDRLYNWATLNLQYLEREIWGDAQLNAKHKTVYQVEIAAVIDTITAFYASERPNVSVIPLNPDLPDFEVSNYSERVGMGHWDTIDRERGVSIQSEAAKMIAVAGALIIKSCYLTPEQRGEVRVERPIEQAQANLADPVSRLLTAGQDPGAAQPATEELILDEGRYPLRKEVLDPRHCMYELNPWHEPEIFVHRYSLTWAQIRDAFSDIADKAEFRDKLKVEGAVEVVDFWTRTHNAILVDNVFYKQPTKHLYPRLPVTISLADAQEYCTTSGASLLVGRPFCQHMLESCRQQSWAMSMFATHLEEGIFSLIKHMGLKPDSMYLEEPENPDDPMVYRPIVQKGANSRFFPLEEGTDLKYMEPPPLSNVMLTFMDQMSKNMSMTGFSPGILSGQAPAGTSGAGAYQITLATRARMEPHRIALERGLGQSLTLDFEIMARWWDYGDQPIKVMRIAQAANVSRAQQITFTDIANVGVVLVKIDPRIRVASDSEIQLMLQAHAQGLMSDLTLINMLAYAQDPDMELKRIAFERMAKTNEQYNAALAQQYAQENNIPIPPSMQAMLAQQMQAQQMAGQGQMPQGQGAPGMLPNQMPSSSPSPSPQGAGGAAQLLAQLAQGGNR
jgi:hypothetical protein